MHTRIDNAPRRWAEAGFTLVEILVVMVILALLAAIAIPTFLSQTGKTSDTVAKSAARTAETAAEILATDNDGKYGGADGVTVANLRGQEETLSGANLSVSGVTDDGYTVTVTSLTGNTFSIQRRPNGTTNLSCTFPSTAGCPANGRWG